MLALLEIPQRSILCLDPYLDKQILPTTFGQIVISRPLLDVISAAWFHSIKILAFLKISIFFTCAADFNVLKLLKLSISF